MAFTLQNFLLALLSCSLALASAQTTTTFPNYYTTLEVSTLPITITKTVVSRTAASETLMPLITTTVFNIVDTVDTQTMHVGSQTLRIVHSTVTTTLSDDYTTITQTFIQASTSSIPTAFTKRAMKIEPTTEYTTLTPVVQPSDFSIESEQTTLDYEVTSTTVSTIFYTTTSDSTSDFTTLTGDITLTLTSTAVNVSYDTTILAPTATSTFIVPTTSTITFDLMRTTTQFVPQTDVNYIDVTIIDTVADNNGLNPSYYNYYTSPTVYVTVYGEETETETTTVTMTNTEVKPYIEPVDITTMEVTNTLIAATVVQTSVVEEITVCSRRV